ncbi:hypothetical protein, partial [Actinomadura sp. KC06]|uniref:hypothetical protein n=1 Tax=Actinomadura sp. KC06 TaxID=2530369 RepID=UPI001A9E5064
LRDGLAGLLDDPHRSFTELRIEPASLVSHDPTISLVQVSTLRGEAQALRKVAGKIRWLLRGWVGVSAVRRSCVDVIYGDVWSGRYGEGFAAGAAGLRGWGMSAAC